MIMRSVLFAALSICIVALSGPLLAQSDQGSSARVFGLSQPASVDELPPGQFKTKLKQLPPQARSRAVKWLQEFSFAEADVQSLDVDQEGGVFYADHLVVEGTAEADPVTGTDAGVVPQGTLDDAFLLHSRPGAPNVVFIDFDGHDFSGTAWNGGASFQAKAYDLDGSPDTFNATERDRIVDIWHRVAEDLAPFNIDVTTEEPASFDRYTGHILVTHTIDKTGADMPSNGGGGVAYVGVFGLSNYHTYYSPALVYYDHLGGGGETYVAEASSHEFGHNLGLSHDGTSTGTEYYGGHGSGLVSWAPIMGNSYYNNITQWSKGEYANANRTQDDLAIIDGKLGYVGDDHGDSQGDATLLELSPSGSVVSSNPEQDPHNFLEENKGVINSSTDVDVFTFVAGTGVVDLAVTPAWDAFYRDTSRRGANLDVDIELRDVNNALVAASDPAVNTSAAINVPVTPGAYYLLVTGTGNTDVPYSDYDSLGQYFINGSVPLGAADETAPTPDPLSFVAGPAAISETEIAMTATVATDDISAVQYNFRCMAGGSGCADSGWQSSASYTASGLAAATQYTFTVIARDQSDNETKPSTPASATTDAPPAYVDYTSQGETVVAGSVSGTHGMTHDDDGSSQDITERESGGKPQDRHTYLEHRWNFNISSGVTATVYVRAWKSGNNTSESFEMEYSTNNGGSFSPLMTIASTSNSNQQMAVIPNAPGGAIILRVRDNHQVSGMRDKSTFHVDHLFIRVDNGTGPPPELDPPIGDPAPMSASPVSSSEINLGWTDGFGNENGFTVDRSLDGSSWSQIEDLPAGSTGFQDSGLDSLTHYFYRVRAYNLDGFSGYAYADGTTLEGTPPPPPPAITLTTSAFKDKGKHRVRLQWTGAGTVDIYRDGSLVASGQSGGSYDDSTGLKGGITYEHRVCAAGGVADCSNVAITTY